MLTEHFVASIHAQLKTPVAGYKDAGVFLGELQPLAGLRQAFKRSATAQNCLAVSETHIFAAQAEKATIHVYNRDKGNHEATVPLNEKITSVTLTASGLLLLLGTEGGRIMAWEVATGRLTSTPQSHLQAVSCLAVDPSSNFLLSGSRDSNVLVWSLSAILSFSNVETTNQSDPRSPIHSLSSQRGPITALKLGHGYSQANIAVSTSEDQSAVVWDYNKGIALRTYLLRGIPRALALDSSDRGFYTTYDDGAVQLVDFYAESHQINTLYDEDTTTPVQPGENNVWKAEGQELGEGLSLALSWDGARLLSGHKSGKIATWDVSKGSFMAVVETLPGTLSNLVMLPAEGLSNPDSKPIRLVDVVKPRIMTSETDGIIPGDYSFSAQLKANMPAKYLHATEYTQTRRKTKFKQALIHPSFSPDILEAGMVELTGTGSDASMPIDGSAESTTSSIHNGKDKKELADLKAQNDRLLQQVAHLQKLQKASFTQLRDKTRAITALAKEQEQLAEIAKREHGWEIADANVEWDLFQQRQSKDLSRAVAGGKDQSMSSNGDGDLERD